MRTILASLAITVALLGAAEARPFYGKLEVGVATDTSVEGTELDSGLVYGAALGSVIGPVRVEAGVSRLSADFAGLDVNATDIHATGYLDFAVTEDTSVYGGAGVDWVIAEAPLAGFEADGAGYHVVGGIARRVNSGLIVEAQARYVNADLDGTNVSSTAFTVGTRFAF